MRRPTPASLPYLLAALLALANSTLLGCASAPAVTTAADPASVAIVLQRSPDVFTANPLDNYPTRLPRFVLPVATNYDDALWINNATSPSLSLGMGLFNVASGPVFTFIQALGRQAQHRDNMDMMRNLMMDFGTPLMSHDISSERDQHYVAALVNTFDRPITEVFVVEMAAELPWGRPDYKAVSLARASTHARLEGRPTITVTTRPAFLMDAGQTSVMTRIEAMPGTWPGHPGAYEGEVIVYSQALGPAFSQAWIDEDRQRFDEFYACAVAEAIEIIQLDIAGKLVDKKSAALLKDYVIDDWDRAYRYAGSKHVVARRGHRAVVRVNATSFGSIIIEREHVRAGATTALDASVASQCDDEPVMRITQ